MRAAIALALLLFACDKLAPVAQDDASPYEIDVELEQEAQELDKLGVERDMLDMKSQITKEALGAAESELMDAKTPEQKEKAAVGRDRAKREYEAAEAARRRFKRQNTAR